MPAKKQVSRDMILATAMEMLKTRGIESMNVKALAQALGCSTQPIYLSFSGMDDLRAELTSAAVNEFLAEIQYNSGHVEMPLCGMPYIRFAMREKKLFQFLFMRPNAFSEMKSAIAPIMEQSILYLMRRYSISHEEAHRFHDQLWVHTHGIASMIATDFCDWDMDKVSFMLSESERCFIQRYGGEQCFRIET